MKLTTIFMSGGGVAGCSMLSALAELEKNEIININDIKNVAGISFGAILSFVMCLG